MMHSPHVTFSVNESFLNDEPNAKIESTNESVSSSSNVISKPNTVAPYHVALHPKKVKVEKWYFILIQIVVPFLISGFGMVAAGLLFMEVEGWDLFVNVQSIIVLVPSLLGLKGDLEMTLASRLSTQVNLEKLDDKHALKRTILGNFALSQFQSIICGLIASCVACLSDLLFKNHFVASHLLILTGASVFTASLTSLLLGSTLIFVIIMAKKLNLNPDNIATPLAASLGDLVTLAILSTVGTLIYRTQEYIWTHVAILAFYVFVLAPFLAIYSNKNENVRDALFQGWLPIISSLVISSASGVLLEKAIKVYRIIATYQPVINGVGGNLVGIYASRLSTSLHRTSEMGAYVYWAPSKPLNYLKDAFFGKKNLEHKTAKILMSIIVPGHLSFFFAIFLLQTDADRPELTFSLVLFYMFAACAQVMSLLLVCYFLVHLTWRLKINPDNFVIPVLTGVGDLIGVSLLFLSFHLTYLAGGLSFPYEERNFHALQTTTTTTTLSPSENITTLSFLLK